MCINTTREFSQVSLSYQNMNHNLHPDIREEREQD
jgi:hypothetical protein